MEAIAHWWFRGCRSRLSNESRFSCGRKVRGRVSARPDRVSGRAHKRNCTLLGGARQLQALVRPQPFSYDSLLAL